MAKIAPVKETVTEKVKQIGLAEEKAERKGVKPLFIVAPVAAITVMAITFLAVRRLRTKSWF